jgi:hypothetical protein
MAAEQIAGEGGAISCMEKGKMLAELLVATEPPPPPPLPAVTILSVAIQGESDEIVDVGEKQFEYTMRTK